MGDPIMVLPLSYKPADNTAPMPVAWIVRRTGLWFRGGKKASQVQSLLATRTSITLASTVSTVTIDTFQSLIPVEIRFKVASGTLRHNTDEVASMASLVRGYTATASNSWSEWEPCHQHFYAGKKFVAQHPNGAGNLQYEIRCAKKQTS